MVRKERLELSRLAALEPKSTLLHPLKPCCIMVYIILQLIIWKILENT